VRVVIDFDKGAKAVQHRKNDLEMTLEQLDIHVLKIQICLKPQMLYKN
jgi:hypothetical protein